MDISRNAIASALMYSWGNRAIARRLNSKLFFHNLAIANRFINLFLSQSLNRLAVINLVGPVLGIMPDRSARDLK